MSVIRVILRREFWQMRWYFLLLLLVGFSFPLLLTPRDLQRDYGMLLHPKPPLISVITAAFLVFFFVYQEHQRGTWLLLPVSREKNTAVRVLLHAGFLALQALVGSVSLYAWVWTGDLRGGPLLPFASFVMSSTAQQLVTGLAFYLPLYVAAFAMTSWRRAMWLSGGWIWAAVTLMSCESTSSLLGITFCSENSRIGWELLVVVCIGVALVVREVQAVGRSRRASLEMLHALWLCPMVGVVVLYVGTVPGPRHDPQPLQAHWQETAMLSDGEIVTLDTEPNVGARGHRRNGQPVFIPYGLQSEMNPGVESSVGFSHLWTDTTKPWEKVSAHGDDLFVSEDRRRVLIFSRETRRQIGCWGEEGVIEGTSCAPFQSEIRVLQQRYAPSSPTDGAGLVGVVLVTSERVIERDIKDVLHERFRGRDILGIAKIWNATEYAVLTKEHVYLTDRDHPVCPSMPLGSVARLADDTLVIRHSSRPQPERESRDEALAEDTVTFCSPKGELRTEPWPTFSAEPPQKPFSLREAVLFPLRSGEQEISNSTWYAAATLRFVGFLLLAAIWRKRGLLVGAPGILLGPAYFLAAAFVMSDPARIMSWLRRKMDMSMKRAHGSAVD